MNKIGIITLLVFLPIQAGIGQMFDGPADFKNFLVRLCKTAEAANGREVIAELDKLRDNESLRLRAFTRIEDYLERSMHDEMLTWITEDPARIVDYRISDVIIEMITEAFPKQMLELVKSDCPHRALLRAKPKPTDLCLDEHPCQKCEEGLENTYKWHSQEPKELLDMRLQFVRYACSKRRFPPTAALLAHEGKCNMTCEFCDVVVRKGFTELANSKADLTSCLHSLHDTPLHYPATLVAVRAMGYSNPPRARAFVEQIKRDYPEYDPLSIDGELLVSSGGKAFSDEEIEKMRFRSTVDEEMKAQNVIQDEKSEAIYAKEAHYAGRLVEVRFNRNTPKQVAMWIESHEDSIVKNSARRELAERWLKADFNAACDWIATLDRGIAKDGIVNEVLRQCRRLQLTNDEYEKVLLLSEDSENPKNADRVSALKSLFRPWFSKDANSAREAIMKCSSLTGNFRERCAQVLVVAPGGRILFDLESDIRRGAK